MEMSTTERLDLRMDLNTMDETGFPWAFLDTATAMSSRTSKAAEAIRSRTSCSSGAQLS